MMNQFSKRSGAVVFALAVAGLAIGGGIVLLTPQILEWLPTFLEANVFHRTFNHAAYFDSLVSLISFPIFIAVVVTAVVFPKFSERQKCVLIWAYIAFAFFITAYVTYHYAWNYCNSDDSSELLLARECFLQKTFWPRSWYYSTEIRVLNTQLIAAPLFFFTQNIFLIKTITVTVTLAVLFLSVLFLVSSFVIERKWLILLCGLLVVCPVSRPMWTFVNFGSFYAPHIAISFFYVGLFLRLSFAELSARRRKAYAAVFLFLAFCGGLGSIRYFLYFIFPLAAVVVGRKILLQSREGDSLSVRGVFAGDRETFWSGLGCAVCMAGYVVNTLVLANLYSVKNYNKVRFLPLGEATVTGVIDMILSVAGYNGNASVFTPAGFATVLLGVVAVVGTVLFVIHTRQKNPAAEASFLRYAVFLFAFAVYINICTEMVERFLLTVTVVFVPSLALILRDTRIPSLHRYILGVSSAILVLTNAFGAWSFFQSRDEAVGFRKACDFLVENGYSFGYAFSTYANPAWFVSNGRLEVGILTDADAPDGSYILSDSYSYPKWLTTKRYYDRSYGGEKRAFLLMAANDAKNTPDNPAFRNGNKIYDADGFVVYDYANHGALIDAFDGVSERYKIIE